MTLPVMTLSVLSRFHRNLWGRDSLPFLISVAVILTTPLLSSSSFVLGLGVTIAIWIIFAVSYAVTFGLAGQFSCGHSATYGIGAYATAILMVNWDFPFWMTLPPAILLGVAMGTILGLPSCRLRGDFVALVTLGIGVIFQEVALNWSPVTGGPEGIANVPNISIVGIEFGDLQYYYFSLFTALIAIALVLRLKRSHLGRSMLAIREDELAAQAMGLRTAKVKILSFAIGGGLAAVAGSLYAVFNMFVSSVSFGLAQSVNVILIVLLGGLDKVWGVVVAAIGLTILNASLTTQSQISLGLTGVLFVIAIILRHGAFGSLWGRMFRFSSGNNLLPKIVQSPSKQKSRS